jgi:C4-type Zn-finger protein
MMNPKPIPNGIACPKCGEELLDTQPNVTLTSMPPQKNVGCSSEKCDYTGYRIA